jgi:pyruvate ferredoxin oxidoreductase alpha subunit
MGNRILIEGNEAVALAMKLIDPDVVAAYPITPATEVVQKFSEYVANGDVTTEFVAVESEHSAMSACIGASCAGGRVLTATSSQGLALMWEMLYVASSLRCPIVMPVANRALSGNINIHCDHSDTMGARDAGWIHLFCENTQAIFDTTVQAVRIAEHPDVRLPVLVCFDGFVISHAREIIEDLSKAEVQAFVGDYDPASYLLDLKPKTVGPLDLQDYYFEHKRSLVRAYDAVPAVIEEVGREFGAKFGRAYGTIEEYRMEGADVALVALGSTSGTIKDVIDGLWEEGKRVGLVSVRAFRPFLAGRMRKALSGVKAVGVFDRSITFGGWGNPVFTEVRSALYGSTNGCGGSCVPVLDRVYGLGGREITMEEIARYADEVLAAAKGEETRVIDFIGVRE